MKVNGIVITFILFLTSIICYGQDWNELNNQAEEYFRNGNINKAIEYSEKALKKIKKENGLNSDYASTIGMLGYFYFLNTDTNKAILYYTESIELFEKLNKQNDGIYPFICVGLANLYSIDSEYEKAEVYFTKSIESYGIIYGTKNKDFLQMLDKLSAFYISNSKFQEALNVLSKYKSICYELNLMNDSTYLPYLFGKAMVYYEISNDDSAKKYINESLLLGTKIFGKDYYQNDFLNRALAKIYENLKDYENAILYYKKSLPIIQKYDYLSPDHASLLLNIGSVYDKMQMYSEALNYYNKSLLIYKELYGEKEDYKYALYFIARAYDLSQKNDSAEYYYQKITNISKQLYGTKSAIYLYDQETLANYYSSREDYSKAINIFEDILEKRNDLNLPADTNYIGLLEGIGTAYNNQMKYDKAIIYFNNALKLRDSISGTRDTSYAKLLYYIGSAYYALTDYANAYEFHKSAKLIYEQEQISNMFYCQLIEAYAGDCNMLKYNTAAEESLLKALNMVESIEGIEKRYYDLSRQLFITYISLENYTLAKEYLDKALNVCIQIYGKSSYQYVDHIDLYRLYYASIQDLSKEEEMITEAMKILTIMGDTNTIKYAYFLEELGHLYYYMYDYEKSEYYLTKSYTIIKDSIDTNLDQYIDLITAFSELYASKYDLESAKNKINEIIKLYEKYGYDNGYEYQNALSSLAFIYSKEGRYDKSISQLRKAQNNCKINNGYLSSQYASLLFVLAARYSEMGIHDSSFVLYNEVLNIEKQLNGGKSISYAYTLRALAEQYEYLCNYSKARELIIKSIDVGDSLKNNSEFLSIAYRTLSGNYQLIGNYEMAEKYCLYSLKYAGQSIGDQSPTYALALNSLANIHSLKGNYTDVDSLYKEAKKIYEKNYGTNSLEYLASLHNLATFYSETGKYSQAQEIFDELLIKNKKIYGDKSYNYIFSLSNYLYFLDKINDENNMQVVYQTFDDLIKQNVIINKDLLRLAISNMATYSLKKKNYTNSFTLYQKLFSLEKKQLRDQLTTMPENLREKYINTSLSNFLIYNSLVWYAYKNNPVITGEGYDNLLFRKGLLLNTITKARTAILESKDTLLINKFRELASINTYISKIYTNEKYNETVYTEIDSLSKIANTIESQISEKSLSFLNSLIKIISWQEIKKQIKSDEAAIEIVRFPLYQNKWTDTLVYAAYIITKETTENPLCVFFNGDEIEDISFSAYKLKIEKQEDDYKSYNNFWAPIDSLIPDKKIVYVSLDGIYNKINLNTLLLPDGKYLGDVKDIRIVSSTRDLIDSVQTDYSSNHTALLIGNPDFNADSADIVKMISQNLESNNSNDANVYSQRNFNNITASQLPWTLKEVESIESVLDKKKYTTTTLTGIKAIEENVKSIKNPGILHIATHGFFSEDITYEKSDRGFEVIDTSENSIFNFQKAIENPLLRSGLLLSGANQTLQGNYNSNSGLDNGILTAYEVSTMNLDSTELVVLSACETGLGEIKNGEGVYGLQRAFRIAGAKCIIMSLWKVDDKATQLLMTSFYINWITNGMTKREAFKAAQKELRTYPEYQKPYYWGGFVMMGE